MRKPHSHAASYALVCLSKPLVHSVPWTVLTLLRSASTGNHSDSLSVSQLPRGTTRKSLDGGVVSAIHENASRSDIVRLCRLAASPARSDAVISEPTSAKPAATTTSQLTGCRAHCRRIGATDRAPSSSLAPGPTVAPRNPRPGSRISATPIPASIATGTVVKVGNARGSRTIVTTHHRGRKSRRVTSADSAPSTPSAPISGK